MPVGGASHASPSSLAPSSAGRFIPGEIVKERYRVVALLGRGGMGEVYRAEDLKLGQDVALKFLPAGLEADPTRLHLFLNEVRTARQVTHPNVCRVFDIDDIDGQHFLSMEYVDGEDLATSLRRTGRLPEERAVPVARQICAGLAAAHDQGILHRDLKPANVMIDGRGRVKLTDFGLASLADAIGADDVAVGTPAYMSPEQITGREVSVRSDIYALGLVLYELFTGRAPFSAQTMADYRRLHTDSMPSQPTLYVPGLDPVVERAIMRCLAKDPAQRPVSALAVAAALPGGDPLQAALAAGETPSPELVAEAGRRDGLAPGRVLLLLAAAVLLLVGSAHWAGRLSVINFVPLNKRPAVLVDRAQEIITQLGYTEPAYDRPVDRAWGYLLWSDVVNEVGAADSTASRWEKLRDRPDAMGFWYRQSPDLMLPKPDNGPVFSRGEVSLTNPNADRAGEVMVVLDLNGRLRRLEVMPKRLSTREPSDIDWGPLFALADLDSTRFRPDRPRYQRFMAPDHRRAWVGTRAGQPDLELRVEAGSFEGRPVLFNVATAAGLESLGVDPEPRNWRPIDRIAQMLQPLLILVIVLFSVRATRRNAVLGRTDRRGALRFASLTFFLSAAGMAMTSHGIVTRVWADEMWPIIAGAAFMGLAAWCLYSAAEPLGRRIWPTMFVSTSRLFSRAKIQWRDPLIGHSVMIGVIAGGFDFMLRGPASWVLLPHLTDTPRILPWFNLALLQGQRMGLAMVVDQGLMLIFLFIQIMALVFIRYLVKRRIPAILLTLVVWALLTSPSSLGSLVSGLLVSALFLFVLLRWGAVAMVVGRVTSNLIWQARPADWTAWHSEGSVVIVVALVVVACYGAWAAVGQAMGRGNET